ncbi:HD domain-containing protein [Porphyromonas pogonae]|uniref:HD domain-containing protein n=1 Tax=Porphyromonas pogonae TaxID=867595 RepID=UPI002E77E320|nr:HD domain-containing protein [Porphyromonas pogonae]
MDPLEIIKKYYNPESKAYNILVRHSMDVTSMALRIARQHPELHADSQFIAEAAMLHDIGMFLTDAPGIDCHGTEPYIRHGYLGAELLRHEGMAQHAKVCERHTGSGLTKKMIKDRKIDLPEGIYTPQSIEEKIICYADKFYSKSNLEKVKTADKIRISMKKYGDEAVRRFEELDKMFGG